jgi:hypothetical protein
MDRRISTPLTPFQPLRQNEWTYTILAREGHAIHTTEWAEKSEYHYLHFTPYTKMLSLRPFLKRAPCKPYTKMGGTISTSLTPFQQYARIDGLISFLYASTLPPTFQNGQTNQNITISIPHTPELIDLYNTCTRPRCHPYAQWTDQ